MKKVNLGVISGLVQAVKATMPVLQQVLREAVMHLPEKRSLQCAQAFEQARFKG